MMLFAFESQAETRGGGAASFPIGLTDEPGLDHFDLILLAICRVIQVFESRANTSRDTEMADAMSGLGASGLHEQLRNLRVGFLHCLYRKSGVLQTRFRFACDSLRQVSLCFRSRSFP